MEIRFYKPTVLDIPKMQELVRPEVEKGIILLRTEDEMATTIRSYIVVEVDGKMAGFTATHIHSARMAEVRSLIVNEEFRGLGLGKKTCRKVCWRGKILWNKTGFISYLWKRFF